MDISVIIPTYQRPGRVAACVAALARQTLAGERYEVLVGLDGEDSEAAAAAERAFREAGGLELRVVECPKGGLALVRNRLLELARGKIMVSVNDDVIAEREFLAEHLRAHERALRVVVVSGASPWVVHKPDRLFDRMVRETPMVFFYPVMDGSGKGADHDWGFRHAWGLNFSAPTHAVRSVGGFAVFPATYGYEDNEIAWRLKRHFGAPVWYRPAAVAHHDHRMEPADYLAREYKLGYAAWGFARQCAECARDMFGRNVASAEELAYSAEYCARERAAAARALPLFERTARASADVVGEASAGLVLDLAYQQHLPLKRWAWRRGLMDGAEGAAMREQQCLADLREPERPTWAARAIA